MWEFKIHIAYTVGICKDEVRPFNARHSVVSGTLYENHGEFPCEIFSVTIYQGFSVISNLSRFLCIVLLVCPSNMWSEVQ